MMVLKVANTFNREYVQFFVPWAVKKPLQTAPRYKKLDREDPEIPTNFSQGRKTPYPILTDSLKLK